MKLKALFALLLVTVLLSNSAETQEYEMKYTPLDASDVDFHTNGQYLNPTVSNSPDESLEGVPEPFEGKRWFLEARLGDGDHNVFSICIIQAGAPSNIRLWMDTNQDKDFSDEKVRILKKAEQGEGYCRYASSPLDLMIPVQEKKVPYRSVFTMTCYNESYEGHPPLYMLESRCCWKGKIRLGDDQHEAMLIDDNSNGIFNDADLSWEHDRLDVARTLIGASFNIWSSSVRVVIKDGQWYFFDPSPDGSRLLAQGMAENLATLTSNLKFVSLEIHSTKTGPLDLQSEEDVIKLPPGEYAWVGYRGDYEFGNGERWRFTPGTVMREPMTIEEGQNHVDLCFPLRQELSIKTEGDVVTIEEQLKGRDGEHLYVYKVDEDFSSVEVPLPTFTILDHEGIELATGAFESG